MTARTITLTARQFRALVEPVLPLAGNDYNLPVLNAILIQAEGKWLTATATDRYRVGIKRIEKVATDDDAATVWPEFSALVPLKAVRSILATAKPTRGNDPAMKFTVADDRLTVEASGLFDLFDAAKFTHSLETGEFPKVRRLFTEALAMPDDERTTRLAVDPRLFADFKACGSTTLRILMGCPLKPLVVTDDAGFIGLLMPRRGDVPAESWDDLFAPVAATQKAAS